MITQILKKASEDWYFAPERYASFVMSLAGPRLAKDSRIILGFAFSQVYYELDDERKKVGASDVAICRVEQLCPFPYDLIQRELKRYPSKHWFATTISLTSSMVLIRFWL